MFTDWEKIKIGPSIDPSALKHLDQFDAKSNGTLVRGVLAAYLNSMPNLMKRLNSAALAGIVQETFQASHNMKSSSDNIGAKKLSDLCRRLEAMTIENPEPEKIKALTSEVLNEASLVLVEAEALLKQAA